MESAGAFHLVGVISQAESVISRRYLKWLLVSFAGVLVAFIAGVKFGEYIEHQRFELLKDFSVVEADKSLAKGDFQKAISALHFTKAFERELLRGGTDAMLAKAYLANNEPCLAQAFADSHLRYMERNALTSLSSYTSTLELYRRASKQCAAVARPTVPVADVAK